MVFVRWVDCVVFLGEIFEGCNMFFIWINLLFCDSVIYFLFWIINILFGSILVIVIEILFCKWLFWLDLVLFVNWWLLFVWIFIFRLLLLVFKFGFVFSMELIFILIWLFLFMVVLFFLDEIVCLFRNSVMMLLMWWVCWFFYKLILVLFV